MRRSIMAGLIASLAIGILAGPVAAHSPRPANPPDLVQEFAAGEVCVFALRLEDWTRSKERTYVDKHGQEKTVVIGKTRTRVTNLDTGRSLWVKYASRLVYWEPGDGTFRLRSTGRQLFYFLDGDQNPKGEGPGLFLVSGRAKETLDLETLVVTKFSYRGHARDICARLD